MATIKYKDREGNFHKVSIGGGSGTDEVYIGSDTPPKGTKVWIDPSGEGGQTSQPSAGVEVIDNLESDSTTAALSANQGRVLKEMIEQGGGGSIAVDDVLSLESTNPVQNKVLTEALEGKTNFRYVYRGYDEKEREYNLETLNIISNSGGGISFEFQLIDEQLGLPFPCFLAIVGQQIGFYCDGYYKMLEAYSPLYASLPAKTAFYALQSDGTLTNNVQLIGSYSPTYIRGIDKSTSHYSALRNDIALNIMPCVALEGDEDGGKRSYALSTNMVHYGDKGIQIVYISKYGTKMLRIFDGTSVRDVSFPLDLNDETLRSFAFDHLKDGGCEVRNGSGMLMLKGAISGSTINLAFFNGSKIEHYSLQSTGTFTLLSTQDI